MGFTELFGNLDSYYSCLFMIAFENFDFYYAHNKKVRSSLANCTQQLLEATQINRGATLSDRILSIYQNYVCFIMPKRLNNYC